MKRRLPVFVDDGVSGVRPALKTDDDVRFRRENVGDLAFSFVAPVGADYRFDHGFTLP